MIQGTAAVAVAAVLGGIKIQKPECKELVVEARGLRYLFHGAGSANLGAASLLVNEANVPQSQVACTNSYPYSYPYPYPYPYPLPGVCRVIPCTKGSCGRDLQARPPAVTPLSDHYH